jgi:hypothetical protein
VLFAQNAAIRVQQFRLEIAPSIVPLNFYLFFLHLPPPPFYFSNIRSAQDGKVLESFSTCYYLSNHQQKLSHEVYKHVLCLGIGLIRTPCITPFARNNRNDRDCKANYTLRIIRHDTNSSPNSQTRVPNNTCGVNTAVVFFNLYISSPLLLSDFRILEQ